MFYFWLKMAAWANIFIFLPFRNFAEIKAQNNKKKQTITVKKLVESYRPNDKWMRQISRRQKVDGSLSLAYLYIFHIHIHLPPECGCPANISMLKNVLAQLIKKCKSRPQWGIISQESEWLSLKSLQIINSGESVKKRGTFLCC